MSIDRDNTALQLAAFEMLPQRIRKKLEIEDVKVLTGGLAVKQAVQNYFSLCARRRGALVHEATALRRFKHTGEKESLCSECRAYFREQRQNRGTHKRKVSAYGAWRAKERALEKAEKERAGK